MDVLKSRFGVLKVRGLLRARTHVFHGGDEKTGSVILINRIRFLINEEPVDIPIISGNAVRGVWRRMVFKDFLDLLGYEIDVSKPRGLRLYHSFFSGGLLETVEESYATIDVSLKRRVLKLVPPARLFGFSLENQVLQGKLKVGMLLPVCKELKDYLPDFLDPKTSVYDLITHVFQTRKDELRTGETKTPVQMIVEYEAFSPGTLFYHEVKLEDPAPIDESCLARLIKLFKQKPFIGGKSSVGAGEVDIGYDFDGDDGLYVRYVRDHKDEITGFLDELTSG